MTRKEVEDLIANKQNIYVLSKNALGKKSITAFDTNLYEFRNFNDFGFEMVDRTHCSKQILWINYSQVKTRQEAEWLEEFGNITRTETLDLPTWEEINKRSLYTLYFNNPELYLYRVYFNIDAKTISIEEQSEEYLECFTQIEEWKLTKENYILACRKAKELFLG